MNQHKYDYYYEMDRAKIKRNLAKKHKECLTYSVELSPEWENEKKSDSIEDGFRFDIKGLVYIGQEVPEGFSLIGEMEGRKFSCLPMNFLEMVGKVGVFRGFYDTQNNNRVSFDATPQQAEEIQKELPKYLQLVCKNKLVHNFETRTVEHWLFNY